MALYFKVYFTFTGRVSSYIKTKVITNLSVARSLARPSFLPPDVTPAPPLRLLTTSDSDLEAEDEAELGRTLPIIEYKQAPLCSRGQERTKLTLPPCSYKVCCLCSVLLKEPLSSNLLKN